MNKERAIELKNAALSVAYKFSQKDRVGNFNGETFELVDVVPASDDSAVVFYKKNTEKIALALFYYLDGSTPGWRYFFPKDTHISGFRAFEHYKSQIERENFKYNFKQTISDGNPT